MQIAIALHSGDLEEQTTIDHEKLQRCFDQLKNRIEMFSFKVNMEPTETIEQASLRGEKLSALQKKFATDAVIVLRSDKTFNGMEAWDALQSVGLEWGDGDLFHWLNTENYGDDQLFSVWTTTSPGYFLPEEVKSGNMNPQDLVFGFSIPRSADAATVLDTMIKAAKYCQKRLGGQLLDKNLDPFNEEIEKLNVRESLREMESEGIRAGSDKALMLF